MEDFEGAAKANREEAIKLTTLARLVRGATRSWFRDLSDVVKEDWDDMKEAFFEEFRKDGEEEEAVLKFAEMCMRKKEPILDFVDRFKKVARKTSEPLTSATLTTLFIATLPKKMGVMVRQLQC